MSFVDHLQSTVHLVHGLLLNFSEVFAQAFGRQGSVTDGCSRVPITELRMGLAQHETVNACMDG